MCTPRVDYTRGEKPRRQSRLGLSVEIKLGRVMKYYISEGVAEKILALDDRDFLEIFSNDGFETLVGWVRPGAILKGTRAYDILQDIRSTLNCPICKNNALPPIFGCVNGHIICEDCCKKLRNCLLCSDTMTECTKYLPVREVIVSVLNFECKNIGCDVVLTGDKIKDHIRPIPCFEDKLKACKGDLVEFHNFEEHIRKYHNFVGFEETMDVYKVVYPLCGFVMNSNVKQDQRFELVYCKNEGKLFFLHVEMQYACLHVWVTLLGSEEEASRSSVLISIGGNNPSVRTDWKVPIHSIHTPSNEIQLLAHCAIIPQRYLRNYCREWVDLTDEDEADGVEFYELEIKFKIENAVIRNGNEGNSALESSGLSE